MSGKIPRMNVDLLRQVRTIVTHDNCADGIASALILHAALPDARIVFSWSLRSRSGVDVSAIAAQHGGGGHTAAAGFSVHDDGRSPYVRASELLRV